MRRQPFFGKALSFNDLLMGHLRSNEIAKLAGSYYNGGIEYHGDSW